jgi:hypothetical protein
MAIVCMLVGCSPGTETNTLPVRGVVTYGDQPVAGAEVALIPRDSSPGVRPARGVSASDGTFTVKTYFSPRVDDPGAQAGDYTVTVSKVEAPSGMTMEEWGEAKYRKPDSVPPLQHLVPKKYGSVRTSDLFVTVADAVVNYFELELTD